MIKQELTYWVTFALIPQMWTKRKNEIFVKCFQHCPQISIIELFEDSKNWDIIGLTEIEKKQFEHAKKQLANNSFMIEELIAQGYDILPITDYEYPKLLKENLKYNSPIVIYSKGNKSLLQEPSIAIVGSRKADKISLSFTDYISKKAVSQDKVIISGFAKGVDRQALDSAVEANGKSIIILPQGIMTFSSGFKQYFKHIAKGNVLVISTFAPKAPWTVEFAMARNPIIYGMASEIFVAQSDEKGGTWAGVIDGLRKNRKIFVRHPEKNEKNANMLLIQKGALPINMNGEIITLTSEEQKTPEQISTEKLNSDVIKILNSVEMISAKEIIIRLHTEWKEEKMKKHLEKMQEVEKIKVKNRVFFRLKGKVGQWLLFD